MAQLPDFPSVWEPYSADSLLDLCVSLCLRDPGLLLQPDGHLKRGLSLPAGICERLLCLRGAMPPTPGDAFLQLFSDPSSTRLERVDIRGWAVTDEGLIIISRHPVTHLDVSQCHHLTCKALDVVNSMRPNLKSLVLGDTASPFVLTGGDDEDRIILHAPNLRKLCWSGLGDQNNAGGLPEPAWSRHLYAARLVEHLRKLTHLDLSKCGLLGDLSCLTQLKGLTALVLFGVPWLQESVGSICQLKGLRHLDISQWNEKYGIYQHPNQVLQQLVDSLPDLTSLDISGTNLAGSGVLGRDSDPADNSSKDAVAMELPMTDIPGLKNRVNRPLEFLGLFNTAHEACYRHHIPAKRIAGDANEEQILVSAQVYQERGEVLQKVLNDLFHVFRYEACSYTKLALDVVMAAMARHLSEKHIQIAGSASLFYIVKGEEKGNFNIKIKRRIIKALLDAMCGHRNDTTMLRNGCLTLIHFKIPQDVLFDYERLVDILLHIVSQEDQDDFVQRIGIYLLNSLACQVDGMQKQLVGDKGAITIMLQLIEARVFRGSSDEVMETAWSTMWNVTDETPVNCQRFLDGGGMMLFLECLRAFADKPELLRNMMGLLGNVAEVKELRPRLMKDEYLEVFSHLLDSTSDGIEVSYNAAGILSHIASDGPELWEAHNIRSVSREQVLSRMVRAIESWRLLTKRNINCRSFEPILRLLKVEHTPEAQHWAVWALANLTKVYPDKYCPLIREEGGVELVQKLLSSSKPYERIKELSRIIIEQCAMYERNGCILEDLDEIS
ncbi:protein zer-1 homolog [Ornithodoros turicata]|uniref:protein zer-1 homolog n=1 Tax=Ornithodoros turicata TaxID=34597 RepID=UPI003139B628